VQIFRILILNNRIVTPSQGFGNLFLHPAYILLMHISWINFHFLQRLSVHMRTGKKKRS